MPLKWQIMEGMGTQCVLRKWAVLSDTEFFLSILKGAVRNIRDVNEHSKFAGHPVPLQISAANTIIAAPSLGFPLRRYFC